MTSPFKEAGAHWRLLGQMILFYGFIFRARKWRKQNFGLMIDSYHVSLKRKGTNQ